MVGAGEASITTHLFCAWWVRFSTQPAKSTISSSSRPHCNMPDLALSSRLSSPAPLCCCHAVAVLLHGWRGASVAAGVLLIPLPRRPCCCSLLLCMCYFPRAPAPSAPVDQPRSLLLWCALQIYEYRLLASLAAVCWLLCLSCVCLSWGMRGAAGAAWWGRTRVQGVSCGNLAFQSMRVAIDT
jgi:hypothetical protein